MDLSQQRFESIIERIYATLDNADGWRAVLEDINDAFGTRAVHMLAFDGSNGALSYSEGADMAPQIDMEYIQKFQFADPRVQLLREQKESEWVHCHEWFDDAFVASSPFYQEFLIPHGARYLSACKLVQNERATILLAWLCRPEDGPLSAEALAFAERLRPHLSRACRVGLDHFVYSAQALVGNALVNKLHQPVVLLTMSGEVVQANQAADSLFRRTPLVQVSNGRLVLPERYREMFAAHCAQLENEVRFGSAEAPTANLQSLRIESEKGTAPDMVYAFFSMLLPERVMGSFGLRPLVMLFLYHPGSAQVIDSSLLTAAFGLSHAECRIATMLADGMQLKTIADTLGVQYDTVRKQLLSIFQKTSTNRQPELVRLLLHMPAATVQRAQALSADL
ncbi:helix-turn-helix transcriptional regulator [Massilia endophytica]|uniref:helix-turn-helix transcriptional regulator n=1 Tax=Massilia endophytica TaxID=2899220 RepID=UPI001E3E5CAB|nr:helix-turn-helix transcriptional regulator [Massilia endophytica]UGQ46094.1 helix-turn-helix transcriptional regulator [Massilia endophytica]